MSSTSKKKAEENAAKFHAGRSVSLKTKIPGVKDLESISNQVQQQNELPQKDRNSFIIDQNKNRQSLAQKEIEISQKKTALIESQRSIMAETESRKSLKKSISEVFQPKLSLERLGKRKIESLSSISLGAIALPAIESVSVNIEKPIKRHELVVGTSLRVITNYAAQNDEELDLKIGDIIELQTATFMENPDYWQGVNRSWGSSNGKEGLFPGSCVELENWNLTDITPIIIEEINEQIETLGPVVEGTKVRVKDSFEPDKTDELALRIGMIVAVLECPDGGWWRGTCEDHETTGISGWFPSTHVELFGDKYLDIEVAAKIIPVKMGTQVIAILTYTPKHSNEIALEIDDFIIVTECPVNGEMWKGMRDFAAKLPKTGWFPARNVEIYVEKSFEPDSAAPETAPRKAWYKRLGKGPVKAATKGAVTKPSGKSYRIRSASAPPDNGITLANPGIKQTNEEPTNNDDLISVKEGGSGSFAALGGSQIDQLKSSVDVAVDGLTSKRCASHKRSTSAPAQDLSCDLLLSNAPSVPVASQKSTSKESIISRTLSKTSKRTPSADSNDGNCATRVELNEISPSATDATRTIPIFDSQALYSGLSDHTKLGFKCESPTASLLDIERKASIASDAAELKLRASFEASELYNNSNSSPESSPPPTNERLRSSNAHDLQNNPDSIIANVFNELDINDPSLSFQASESLKRASDSDDSNAAVDLLYENVDSLPAALPRAVLAISDSKDSITQSLPIDKVVTNTEPFNNASIISLQFKSSIEKDVEPSHTTSVNDHRPIIMEKALKHSPSIKIFDGVKTTESRPNEPELKVRTEEISASPAIRQINADFWKDRISKEELEKMSSKDQKRQTTIWELIFTEKDYVRDISMNFLYPMSERKILSAKNIDFIFNNLEAVLAVNKDFLKALEDRAAESALVDQVSDLFLKSAEKFISYTVYCSHQAASLGKLKELQAKSSVRTFLEETCKSSGTRRLDLGSFLIKPVQRLCKYPLLIRELIKHTNEDNQEYAALKVALEKIQAIISIVNDGARTPDGLKNIIDIQNCFAEKINFASPNRYLVREENLLLFIGGARKPRRLLLFNDMIMLVRTDWRDKYHLIEKVMFRQCGVSDIQDETDVNLMEIEIGEQDDDEEKNRYVLVFPSKVVKANWIESFKNLSQLSVKTKKFLLPQGGGNDNEDDEEDEERKRASVVTPIGKSKTEKALVNEVKELREKLDTVSKSLSDKSFKIKQISNERNDLRTEVQRRTSSNETFVNRIKYFEVEVQRYQSELSADAMKIQLVELACLNKIEGSQNEIKTAKLDVATAKQETLEEKSRTKLHYEEVVRTRNSNVILTAKLLDLNGKFDNTAEQLRSEMDKSELLQSSALDVQCKYDLERLALQSKIGILEQEISKDAFKIQNSKHDEIIRLIESQRTELLAFQQDNKAELAKQKSALEASQAQEQSLKQTINKCHSQMDDQEHNAKLSERALEDISGKFVEQQHATTTLNKELIVIKLAFDIKALAEKDLQTKLLEAAQSIETIKLKFEMNERTNSEIKSRDMELFVMKHSNELASLNTFLNAAIREKESKTKEADELKEKSIIDRDQLSTQIKEQQLQLNESGASRICESKLLEDIKQKTIAMHLKQSSAISSLMRQLQEQETLKNQIHDKLIQSQSNNSLEKDRKDSELSIKIASLESSLLAAQLQRESGESALHASQVEIQHLSSLNAQISETREQFRKQLDQLLVELHSIEQKRTVTEMELKLSNETRAESISKSSYFKEQLQDRDSKILTLEHALAKVNSSTDLKVFMETNITEKNEALKDQMRQVVELQNKASSTAEFLSQRSEELSILKLSMDIKEHECKDLRAKCIAYELNINALEKRLSNPEREAKHNRLEQELLYKNERLAEKDKNLEDLQARLSQADYDRAQLVCTAQLESNRRLAEFETMKARASQSDEKLKGTDIVIRERSNTIKKQEGVIRVMETKQIKSQALAEIAATRPDKDAEIIQLQHVLREQQELLYRHSNETELFKTQHVLAIEKLELKLCNASEKADKFEADRNRNDIEIQKLNLSQQALQSENTILRSCQSETSRADNSSYKQLQNDLSLRGSDLSRAQKEMEVAAVKIDELSKEKRRVKDLLKVNDEAIRLKDSSISTLTISHIEYKAKNHCLDEQLAAVQLELHSVKFELAERLKINRKLENSELKLRNEVDKIKERHEDANDRFRDSMQLSSEENKSLKKEMTILSRSEQDKVRELAMALLEYNRHLTGLEKSKSSLAKQHAKEIEQLKNGLMKSQAQSTARLESASKEIAEQNAKINESTLQLSEKEAMITKKTLKCEQLQRSWQNESILLDQAQCENQMRVLDYQGFMDAKDVESQDLELKFLTVSKQLDQTSKKAEIMQLEIYDVANLKVQHEKLLEAVSLLQSENSALNSSLLERSSELTIIEKELAVALDKHSNESLKMESNLKTLNEALENSKHQNLNDQTDSFVKLTKCVESNNSKIADLNSQLQAKTLLASELQISVLDLDKKLSSALHEQAMSQKDFVDQNGQMVSLKERVQNKAAQLIEIKSLNENMQKQIQQYTQKLIEAKSDLNTQLIAKELILEGMAKSLSEETRAKGQCISKLLASEASIKELSAAISGRDKAMVEKIVELKNLQSRNNQLQNLNKESHERLSIIPTLKAKLKKEQEYCQFANSRLLEMVSLADTQTEQINQYLIHRESSEKIVLASQVQAATAEKAVIALESQLEKLKDVELKFSLLQANFSNLTNSNQKDIQRMTHMQNLHVKHCKEIVSLILVINEISHKLNNSRLIDIDESWIADKLNKGSDLGSIIPKFDDERVLELVSILSNIMNDSSNSRESLLEAEEKLAISLTKSLENESKIVRANNQIELLQSRIREGDMLHNQIIEKLEANIVKLKDQILHYSDDKKALIKEITELSLKHDKTNDAKHRIEKQFIDLFERSQKSGNGNGGKKDSSDSKDYDQNIRILQNREQALRQKNTKLKDELKAASTKIDYYHSASQLAITKNIWGQSQQVASNLERCCKLVAMVIDITHAKPKVLSKALQYIVGHASSEGNHRSFKELTDVIGPLQEELQSNLGFAIIEFNDFVGSLKNSERVTQR